MTRHWANELQRKSFYGSHMPVIARLVDMTQGPILELGMGIYSTSLLDVMCHEGKRTLISYDNDPAWFKENQGWESDYHKVHFVNNYNEADIENTHWSVALVDHRPALRRIIEIKRLAPHAEYIIVHDTEPECDRFFRYSKIYPLFKYRFDYRKCRPHTTVLSNFFDPKNLFGL